MAASRRRAWMSKPTSLIATRGLLVIRPAMSLIAPRVPGHLRPHRHLPPQCRPRAHDRPAARPAGGPRRIFPARTVRIGMPGAFNARRRPSLAAGGREGACLRHLHPRARPAGPLHMPGVEPLVRWTRLAPATEGLSSAATGASREDFRWQPLGNFFMTRRADAAGYGGNPSAGQILGPGTDSHHPIRAMVVEIG